MLTCKSTELYPSIPDRLNLPQIQSMYKTWLFEIVDKYCIYVKSLNKMLIRKKDSEIILPMRDYNKLISILRYHKNTLHLLLNKMLKEQVEIIHGEKGICSICTEEIVSYNCVKLEECKHFFCRTCILEWARTNHVSCPNCRKQDNFLFKNQPLTALKYDAFEDRHGRYYGMNSTDSVKRDIIESVFDNISLLHQSERLSYIRNKRKIMAHEIMNFQLRKLLMSLDRLYFLVNVNFRPKEIKDTFKMFEEMIQRERYCERELFDLQVTDWCFLQCENYIL